MMNMIPLLKKLAAAGALSLLASCVAVPPAPPPAPPVPPVPPVVAAPALQPVAWDAVAGWGEDDIAQVREAFAQSCAALKTQPAWQKPCQTAATQPADTAAWRQFFETGFTPYQVTNPDGGVQGLITGYYEPLLFGSRTPDARYRFPLYTVPDDLLVVDLSAVYPELKNMRLRGRLQGNKVIPYFNRAEIENGPAPVKGRELFWVDDPIELFFLQIQGAGRIALPTGEMARVGYADQNGHPYRSIGKVLIERGELTADKASMQGIKNWAQQRPDKLAELLNSNPSYVFFRELPNTPNGPPGALGVPLTAGRSVAVDPRSIPLGAPVFLATTWPNNSKPLNRLMMAQDTGGAIRGSVRADFFWGFGPDAGKQAGGMKQSGRMWLLWPKDQPLPNGK